MDIVTQMKKFIEPKSVAIIGVSRSPMTIRGATIDVLASLIDQGYQGKIYPIHPQASEIQGLKAYATIAEAPDNIDLAVINLPRNLIPEIVKQCVDKDIKAISVTTQGFADAGDDEGKRLQMEMEGAVRGTDARILGPNTLGAANAYVNFNSAFMNIRAERIPVGLMCQTGVFLAGLADSQLVGKGIDLGNGSDINFSDGLEYFEQDAETKVIGLHVEGIRDARFLEVASRVSRKKPIIALKTGRCDQAAQAAQSHTGGLVGKDEVWDAAFQQAGVIRASDIEELGDMVKAFYTLPPMKGRRVGIITYAGGFGIMGVDACHQYGLEMAKLSPATINRLNALYPSWQDVGNPADIWPAVMVTKRASLSEVQNIVAETLLDDPGVDAVLCIFGAFIPGFEVDVQHLVQQSVKSHPDKPLVFFLYSYYATEVKYKLESKGNTVVFPSPERAIKTLGKMADYSEFRRKIT